MKKLTEIICNKTTGDVSIKCGSKVVQHNDELFPALAKLNNCENLEEMGHLVVNQFKPGESIWSFDEDGDVFQFLFIGSCEDFIIGAARYTWCEGRFKFQLRDMENETQENGDTHVMIYHKNRVFRTREAAEVAAVGI